MPSDLYCPLEDELKIIILNRDNEVQAEVGLSNAVRDFTSISYVKKINGWGSFAGAVIWADSPWAEYILPNYCIVIMRRIKDTLDWITDFAGFIRRIEQTTPADIDLMQIWGRGIGSIIGKYMIEPAAGYGYDIKTGRADDVIKEFVRDQCLNDPDKVFPNFVVGGNTSRSDKEDTWKGRYNRLDKFIKTIRDAADDFDYVTTISDDLSTFIFDTYYPQFGRDLRVGNPFGNEPLVFSLENRNMRNPRYWEAGFDGATEIVVLGQGYLEERTVISVRDEDLEDTWGFHQTQKDARHTDVTAELTVIGESELEDKRPSEGMTFEVMQSESCRYYADWRLGDKTTGRYLDKEADFLIEEIRITVTSGQLEGIAPSLKQISDIRALSG